jgi:glycosyltransferase 2 family protein
MAADESLLLADRAQLLTVTALAVGPERAVRVAAATIGNQALERVLPYLQRAALDTEVWHEVKKGDRRLEKLRVAAEQETGSAPKELEQLR